MADSPADKEKQQNSESGKSQSSETSDSKDVENSDQTVTEPITQSKNNARLSSTPDLKSGESAPAPDTKDLKDASPPSSGLKNESPPSSGLKNESPPSSGLKSDGHTNADSKQPATNIPKKIFDRIHSLDKGINYNAEILRFIINPENNTKEQIKFLKKLKCRERHQQMEHKAFSKGMQVGMVIGSSYARKEKDNTNLLNFLFGTVVGAGALSLIMLFKKS